MAEKDIARLLQLAASSLAFLQIPQGEGDDTQEMPLGEERSERFVQEATAYFDTLEVSITSSVASLRHIYACFALSRSR